MSDPSNSSHKCTRNDFYWQRRIVVIVLLTLFSAAPKLKDADLPEEKIKDLYWELVKIVRLIYQKAKLVHADLSEYNILYEIVSNNSNFSRYFKKKLHIIDVSQAVEHEHPYALNFLRKDCSNVNDFFAKKGTKTLTVKELFDFVVDPTITDENVEECITIVKSFLFFISHSLKVTTKS